MEDRKMESGRVQVLVEALREKYVEEHELDTCVHLIGASRSRKKGLDGLWMVIEGLVDLRIDVDG